MKVAEHFKIEELVFLVILFWVSCTEVAAYPARYKEGLNQPVEMTTTPKKIKDTFQLNKQVMPIPHNESKKPQQSQGSKLLRDDIAYAPVTYKVKHSDSGNKQSDDDDDDDDDGGEYEGSVDYASCKKKEQEEPQEKKSMPMMIIRGFDVMAMDLPLPGGKECKKPSEPMKECEKPQEEVTKRQEELGCENQDENNLGRNNHNGFPIDKDSKQPKDKYKDWGEWSPCSKSCGIGVQSRSKIHPSGSPSRDTQFQPCRLADCPEPRMYQSRVMPSQYEYRDLVRN